MKRVLRLAGALALLIGVAFVVVGCVVYVEAPTGGDVETLVDALNAVAIGAFGALLGVSLVVYAGRTPKPGA